MFKKLRFYQILLLFCIKNICIKTCYNFNFEIFIRVIMKHAIILCAGVGSRLSALTNLTPKSLIKVNGREILDYAIAGYLKAGLNQENILVVTGYKCEMIAEFLAQHYPQICTIKNRDFATTNNMYSLYLALRELPLDLLDTLFINNGDCLYEESLMREFIHSPLQNAIAIKRKAYNDESMKITLGAQNSLINIAKDIAQNQSYGISVDLYKFSRPATIALFEILREFIEIREDLTQWSEVAFPPLFRQIAVYPHDIDSKKWVEVDNAEDLALADRIFSEFDLSAKKALICDMDGTLYVGDKPLQKSIDFIKRAKQEIFFLTNNTSKIPSDYVDKLANFGIRTDLEHIITPLNALIEYLKAKAIDCAYLVANERVAKYLQDSLPSVDFRFNLSRNKAVILTFDTQINYAKLQNICNLLNNTNAEYIATHSDIFCPSECGALPDIGSYIALLQSTTAKSPSVILGKPNVALVESILCRFTSSEIAVIGDRIYTDKALADNMACDFVLTLTGETKRSDLQGYVGKFPALVVKNLGDIDLDKSDSMPRHEREREREICAKAQIDFTLDFIRVA